MNPILAQYNKDNHKLKNVKKQSKINVSKEIDWIIYLE
jgi:hypothetical protein